MGGEEIQTNKYVYENSFFQKKKEQAKLALIVFFFII